MANEKIIVPIQFYSGVPTKVSLVNAMISSLPSPLRVFDPEHSNIYQPVHSIIINWNGPQTLCFDTPYDESKAKLSTEFCSIPIRMGNAILDINSDTQIPYVESSIPSAIYNLRYDYTRYLTGDQSSISFWLRYNTGGELTFRSEDVADNCWACNLLIYLSS
jgi:hypothetical protein